MTRDYVALAAAYQDGVLEEHRTCKKCGVSRPLDQFARTTGEGRRHRCYPCDLERVRQWTKKKKAEDPEGFKRKTFDDSTRRRLKRFGMSVQDYERMLQEQGGVCAICRQTTSHVTKWGSITTRLPVDHDHATGEVRGLLCHACNKAIGLFKDSPELLTAAAAYLRRRRQ